MTVGETITIVASAEAGGSWYSSNVTAATAGGRVDDAGRAVADIYGVAEGSTTVTYTLGDSVETWFVSVKAAPNQETTDPAEETTDPTEETSDETPSEETPAEPEPKGTLMTLEAATDIRSQPDGVSDILVTAPAGTQVYGLGTQGDWLQVILGDITGYIYRPSQEEPADCPVKVTIFSSRRSVMEPGETIVLTSDIRVAPGYETKLQWQCNRGAGFEDVAGANSDSYSFAASIETLSYSWRLVVYYRPAV